MIFRGDKMNININFNGFFVLLTIAFIVLKLCNVITWSWWLVLSPILCCLVLGIVIGLLALCLCALGVLLGRD